MAQKPVTDDELIDRFGPHLNHEPPGGWDAGLKVDKVVETHCCFCGQQCGIKLKVHQNEVVGFEPWYEFPFNEGKLCPAASAWCRRAPRTRSRSASTATPTRGVTSRSPTSSGPPAPTSPRRFRSRPATSGGHAIAAPS